jgi:O-antigen/teichoic acid export membrane protein
LAGLLPFAQSLANVTGNALGALERPDLGFWSSAAGGAVALALGVPLASRLGVGAALAGLVVSYLIMGVIMLVFLRRSLRRAAYTTRT